MPDVTYNRPRNAGYIDANNVYSSLRTGLTHAYQLGEASGDRADSIGTLTLLQANAPGNAAGMNGNGISLTAASSQYATSGPSFSITSSFTLSFWFKPTSTALSGQRGLFSVGNTPTDGSAALIVLLNHTTAKITLYDAGGGGYHDGATTLVATTWYHVCLTRTGAGAGVLYLNGASEVTVASSTNTGNGLAVYLGSGFGGYFDGVIDEMSVWSRILSSAEIARLYNAGHGVFYPNY